MLAVSRRLSRSALGGLLAWGALLFVPLDGGGPLELAGHLVLLAPLALVPLYLDAALPASFSARPGRLLTAVSWGLLPAALCAAVAFTVPAGPAAGALVVPWGLVTAALALWALRRAWALRSQGGLDAPEVLVTAGLAMLPGGAVWLFLARAGLDPGPYGDLVVLLTAAHFHYAAFVAPLWAGLLGRLAPPALRTLYAALATGLLVGFWLVALGIAASRGPGGAALVEAIGVVVLTLSAIGMGGLGAAVASRFESRATGLMVAVSGGALALAMGLALWFHLGPRLGIDSPNVAWMLQHHGWINAIGFALWGALGWRRLKPRPRIAVPTPA